MTLATSARILLVCLGLLAAQCALAVVGGAVVVWADLQDTTDTWDGLGVYLGLALAVLGLIVLLVVALLTWGVRRGARRARAGGSTSGLAVSGAVATLIGLVPAMLVLGEARSPLVLAAVVPLAVAVAGAVVCWCVAREAGTREARDPR